MTKTLRRDLAEWSHLRALVRRAGGGTTVGCAERGGGGRAEGTDLEAGARTGNRGRWATTRARRHSRLALGVRFELAWPVISRHVVSRAVAKSARTWRRFSLSAPLPEALCTPMAAGAERAGFEEFVAPNGNKKLRCRLTGHEIADRPEAIEAHLASRRYRIAAAKVPKESVAEWEKHYIVPSKNGGHGRGVLYCTLTRTHLNAVKEELEAHIQGRRYKAALGACRCVSADGD